MVISTRRPKLVPVLTGMTPPGTRILSWTLMVHRPSEYCVTRDGQETRTILLLGNVP